MVPIIAPNLGYRRFNECHSVAWVADAVPIDFAPRIKVTARKQVVTLLISDGYVQEFEKPRSRARPEKWLRRTDKKFNRTSFVIPKAVTELVTDELQTTSAGICN